MRKILGLSLAVLMVGLVFWYLIAQPDKSNGSLTAVKGVVGSEKADFFNDPRVKERFEELGYSVTADRAGSRKIADPSEVDISQYDFAFPSSSSMADKVRSQHPDLKEASKPFFSPMVIATWQPIVELLTADGMMRDVNGTPELDVAAYIAAVQEGKRWSDLPEYQDKHNARTAILISTTDPRSSNSAAMFQGMVSYVANGDKVVSSNAEVDAVQPIVDQVFVKQGYIPQSSKDPMDRYFNMGVGQAPMVLCYEAQFIEAEQAGRIKPEMVMAQPSVSVYSQHIVLSRTDEGHAVGKLISNDEELQKLASAHGFRAQMPGVFEQTVEELGMQVPSLATNVIEVPAFEFGERMVEGVGRRYDQDGLAPVADEPIETG